jgi:large subunit ribosomal protein L3
MVRGSLQYWPHRRAGRRLARLRRHPKAAEPVMNIVAFKAGMTHVMMVDDSTSPSKNMEVMRSCTILEIPRMEVYGIRLYAKDPVANYSKAVTEIINKPAAAKLKIKTIKNDESKLGAFKDKAKDYSSISALIASYPKEINAEQNHPLRFESPVGGKTIEESFDNAAKLLGKEIKASDFFKAGEFIDVSSVSTGKGWASAIKRHNATRQYRKATGRIRHVGPLGSFGDANIRFTVPRAGQMGYNYRTEHNKRILKIGTKADVDSVNTNGGFKNYGPISGDFIMLDGSVPGTTKRVVRVRKSIRERNIMGIKEPKIIQVAK